MQLIQCSDRLPTVEKRYWVKQYDPYSKEYSNDIATFIPDKNEWLVPFVIAWIDEDVPSFNVQDIVTAYDLGIEDYSGFNMSENLKEKFNIDLPQ